MSTATELRYLKGTNWVRRGYTDVAAGGSTPVGAGTATDIQNLLTAGAAGQTFLLAANTVYTGFEAINQSYGLVFKTGQKLVGQTGTVLDGSVLLTAWTVHSAGVWRKDGVLPAGYADDGGQCEIPPGSSLDPALAGACYKREQVFRDGVHLTRVMRLVDVGPGKFYQDFTANRVYVGDDPTGHELRMSRARYLIQSADSAYPNALSGCALSNLTIRRFASVSQKGAVTLAGPGWVVSNCVVTQNHAIGLHLANADNAWIHHNTFAANGQLGMGHNSSDNTIVEDNKFYGNNTDSYWAADWESGGYKCTYSLNNVFRRNQVHNNIGVGAWWDIDNRDADVYDNDIWDNQADGIRYEISYGAKIHDNWITGNGLYFPFGGRVPDSPYSMLAVAGVNVNSSPNVKVYNNMMSPDPARLVDGVAVHTRGNQNGVGAQMRARGNGGFGPRDLNNFESHHNDVTLTSYYLADIAKTTGLQFGETVNGIRTLSVDTALYYSAAKANRFYSNTYRIDATTKNRFAWKQTYMKFSDVAGGTGIMQVSAADGNPQEVGSVLLAAPRPGLRVAAGGDDGTWTSVGTTAFSATTAANLIGDFAADNYGHCAWIRLTGLNIPRGATIDTAYLEVLTKGANGTPPPMLIRGHNAGSSAQPTTRPEIGARPRTFAQVPWAPPTWPAGSWISTPPVTAIIQELVNRSDWVAGNAVTLFIEPETLGFSVQQLVSFTAYDDPSRSGAGLIYTYH